MIIYSIGKRFNSFKVKFYCFFGTKKGKEDKTVKTKAYDDNDGTGFKRWYHDNGKLKVESYYILFKLNGISTFYYENGAIKARENYVDDKLDGLSKTYYENGKCKCEIMYRNNSEIWRREFDKFGNLIK
jgi:antitoxin component YwqK of YwqJK toxin-antitoxin module